MNYKQLLHNITTFVLDVDGVLTDGKLLIAENGELLRTMNAKDGYAIKAAINQGYRICIITGGRNIAVKSRLSGLGITDIYLDAHDKIEVLEQYVSQHQLDYKNILYMGDDMPDVPVLEKVGLASCPQDAIVEVKAVCDYISHKNGGETCVRDVIEQVMKVQGKWNVSSGKTVTSS